MKDFVLDASVSLGWLIDDPPSPYAGRVQQLMIHGARPLVPIHWHLEVLMRYSPHNGENFCAASYVKFWRTSML